MPNTPILIKEWMKHPLRLMILIYLKDNYLVYSSKIRRELKITINSTWKNLKYLNEKKLIYPYFKNKSKHKKYISLTDKGRLISEKLSELDLLFSSI